METKLSQQQEQQLLEELKFLDSQQVEFEGVSLKPSQCYHWESDPAHLLFNTNCPADLKKRVESIISKYLPRHENSAS